MIVATARDAADLLQPLLADAPERRRVVLHLDRERRLLAIEDQAGDRAGRLPLRDILADALRHRAAGLVIAHGRPDGEPEPSPAEIAATRRLADAAAGLGLILHDHLLFAGGRCASFRELGLL